MLYLQTFESFKLKKNKKLKKHYSSGRLGAVKVIRAIGDDYDDNSMKTNKELKKLSKKIFSKSHSVLKILLEQLCKRFKVKKVKYEQSGTFGMAFIADNDKVIKLTSNQSEASIVQELIDKQKITGDTIPGTIKYYDIVYLENYDIYAILMQRVEPLNKKEKELYKEILSVTDLLGSYENDEDLESDIVSWRSGNFLFKTLQEWLPNYKKEEILKSLKLSRELIDKLQSSDITMGDLHPDNIGWVGDKLVHFDAGSQYTNEEELKKIEKFNIES